MSIGSLASTTPSLAQSFQGQTSLATQTDSQQIRPHHRHHEGAGGAPPPPAAAGAQASQATPGPSNTLDVSA